MNGLFTLLIVGLLIHMLFSRSGGMGGCGGHKNHQARDWPRRNWTPPGDWKGDVIDLNEEDYQVVSIDEKDVVHRRR